jgi:glycosyl hydrolase family 26
MALPRKHRLLCLSAATFLVALTALASSPAQASAAIRFGIYSGAPGQATALEDPAVLDRYIANVGRAPAFVHDYGNVTDPLLTQSEVENLRSHNTGVMMTWQLFKSGWSGDVITLPDLAAGRYDSSLRAAAQQAKSLPFEVMIRFAHEMNGDWYPWRPGGPAGNVGSNYVDAWRHIVTVFRQEGATNVKWVWSPNVDYDGTYPFAAYFPGDEWVDYVALDGYNWGTSGQGADQWQSVSEVFSSAYSKLTQMSSRPVMIAETSSSEDGGDKAAWIRQGFLSEIPQRFPRVTDVAWFDRDMELDWRIDSSSASLAAYRDVLASTLYGGTVPPGASTPPSGRKKKKHKTIRRLRVTRRVGYLSTRVSKRRINKRSKRGGVRGQIHYRLVDRAEVQVTIERRNAKGRYKTKAVVRRGGDAGRTRIPLGRLSGKVRFRPGVYRVSLTATDREGDPSHRRATFRVVPVR